jgi:ABC-type transport system involved in multi-copper enzyme maturation permease subunit
MMTLSTRGLAFLCLAVFPWFLLGLLNLLIWRGVSVQIGGATLYGNIVVGYYMGFLVPLASLFFGVALVAEEAEGGTLPYLFGRPVPRHLLLLAKFLGMEAVLLAGTGVSMAGSYLLAHLEAGPSSMVKSSGDFLMDLCAAGLGLVVYGALFTLMGLAFQRPLFWGFLVGFGWENMVAWLPGFLKRLTILFHLHTLMPQPTEPKGLLQLLAASESKLAALIFLAAYGAAFLALSFLVIRRLEAAHLDREG